MSRGSAIGRRERGVPQRNEESFELGARCLEKEHVDDDLGELGEIVDHLEAPLDVLADLLDEEVVERLQRRTSQQTNLGH